MGGEGSPLSPKGEREGEEWKGGRNGGGRQKGLS